MMARLSVPARHKPAKGDQSTDLVDGRNDGGIRKDLFLQLLLGEVGDPDTLDLSGLEQILHLLPGVLNLPIEQDVAAGTIWEGGEIWVVSVWVQGDLVENVAVGQSIK
jgi:hypothetical protein